jgi:hypothetical protein
MIEIDETSAWPLVWPDVSQLSGWSLSRLLPRLTMEHQLELVRNWLDHPSKDAWGWDPMVEAIAKIHAPSDDLIPILHQVGSRLKDYPGKAQSRVQLQTVVAKRLRELTGK